MIIALLGMRVLSRHDTMINDDAVIQIPIHVLQSYYSMNLLWSLHYWVCAFSVAMIRWWLRRTYLRNWNGAERYSIVTEDECVGVQKRSTWVCWTRYPNMNSDVHRAFEWRDVTIMCSSNDHHANITVCRQNMWCLLCVFWVYMTAKYREFAASSCHNQSE